MDVAALLALDKRPPLWRRFVRRLYTTLLLATHADEVRARLLTDPHLFNARHYANLGDAQQFAVMAIHYNTMIDTRAALTADEVRALLARQ